MDNLGNTQAFTQGDWVSVRHCPSPINQVLWLSLRVLLTQAVTHCSHTALASKAKSPSAAQVMSSPRVS